MTSLFDNKRTNIVIGTLGGIFIILLIVFAVLRGRQKGPAITPGAPTPTAVPQALADEPQPGVEYETIDVDVAKREIIVGALVRKLPTKGTNFSMRYSYADNIFYTIIKAANKAAGDKEFNEYLKMNKINDRKWIPNLTVTYE
ncbi:MAG: hypothetical protein RI947_258 [Candidatus Parcubacteria bacterium]|jgi:hypothetical protein